MQRMRKRNLLPALLLGFGLLGLMALPAPAETADAKKIAKLIEDLGSETFTDRQKATIALDTIGEPALEALRKAAKSSDAEVRKRAGELVSKIETRVQSGQVLKAKMVHLVCKNTPIADAVADLRKQSGYLVVLHDPDGKLKDKKITLDTGKVTFWNALEQFCAKAGLTDGDPNANRFGPVNGPFNPLPQPPVGVPIPGGKVLPVPGGAKHLPAREIKKEDVKKEDAKKVKEQPAANPVAVARPGVVVGAPAVVVPGIAVKPALPPVGGPPVLPPNFRPWVPVQAGQITLVAGTPPSKAVDTSSSVRIRATDKKTYRITDKEITLFLEVTPEPKVRMQNVMSVTLDKATDDNDQKLTLLETPVANNPFVGGVRIMILPAGGIARPAIGGPWMAPSSNGLSHVTPLRFKKEAKETKSLKELSGTVSAQVLGEAESMLSVDQVMKAAGKSFKGKQAGEIKILTTTKQADGTIQITFEFELPAGVVPETQINVPQPAVNPPPVPAPPRRRGPAGAAGAAKPLQAQAQVGVAVQAVVAKPLPAIQPAPPPGVAIAVPIGRPIFPGFAYNGLSLQDDKGNVLPASIFPNWKKGGFRVGGKMEYIATYKPQPKGAAEPTRLVFTARKQIAVSIPFTLKNVELK
jgi:hypothetical protein